jgi:hypothetical protein
VSKSKNSTPESLDAIVILAAEGLVEDLESWDDDDSGGNPFKPTLLVDLIKKPPKEYIVEKLFGYRDSCIIVGDSAVGKSFFAIDLAVRGAMGLPIADTFKTNRPFATLYCSEEGVDGIPQRFKAACEHHGILDDPEAMSRIAYVDVAPKLFHALDSGEGLKNFVTAVRNLENQTGVHFDVIVIDTLSDAAEGSNENDNGHISTINLRLRKLRKMLKTTTFLLHHTAKYRPGPRGGTGHRGKSDFLVELDRDGDKRSLNCNKNKDSRDFVPKTWRLVEHGPSAFIKWESFDGGKISRPADSKQAIMAEIVSVLRKHRDDAGQGLRAEDIRKLLEVSPTVKTLQSYLKSLRDDPLTAISGEQRQICDVNGKPNNMAWFYFMEVESGTEKVSPT